MKKLISVVLAVLVAFSAMLMTTASALGDESNGLSDSLSDILGSITNLPGFGEEMPEYDQKTMLLTAAEGIEAIIQYGVEKGFITEESAKKTEKYLNELTETLNSETASDDEIGFASINLGMSLKIDIEIVYNEALVEFITETAQAAKELIALIGTVQNSDAIEAAIDKLIENANALNDINEGSVKKLLDDFIESVQDAFVPSVEDMLEAAVSEAQEIIDSGDYTEEELAALVEVLENAKALLEDKNATSEKIEEMTELLYDAILSLDFGEDIFEGYTVEDLLELIAWVTEDYIDSGYYDEEALTALKQAIDDAKALLEENMPTSEDIEAAIDAIWDAIPEETIEEPTMREVLNNQIYGNAIYIISGGSISDTKETLSAKRDNVIFAESVYLSPLSTEDDCLSACELLRDDISYIETIFGDADYDGYVNIKDATAVQKYVAELDIPEFSLTQADVDGDGTVTIKDATLIQKHSAELINIFPVEA